MTQLRDWYIGLKSVKMPILKLSSEFKNTMSKHVDNVTNNFEQQLEALEQIVNQMEQGELSLEDSIKQFEQGITLANQCQKALEQAEMRVKVLMSENDQELQDFIPDDEQD